MFFDETPIVDHTTIDLQQLQKVRDFKGKYIDKGIYWPYNSLENFRKIFDAHITRYFLTFQEIENIKGTHKSDLTVKSYYQGNIVESAVLSKFDMGGLVSSERILKEIKTLFERIPRYKITDEYFSGALSMDKKVEIPENVTFWIDAMAKNFGYDTKGEFSFADLFEIQESKDFISYTSTLKNPAYIPQNIPFSPFSNSSYEDGYRETLDEIFDYTVFEDGEMLIIKVHMDYLKQHNNAAFPTWIFLKESEEYSDIEYSIISKNRPDIVKASLKIEFKVSEQ